MTDRWNNREWNVRVFPHLGAHDPGRVICRKDGKPEVTVTFGTGDADEAMNAAEAAMQALDD